jgi:hypothetical protein
MKTKAPEIRTTDFGLTLFDLAHHWLIVVDSRKQPFLDVGYSQSGTPWEPQPGDILVALKIPWAKREKAQRALTTMGLRTQSGFGWFENGATA